MPGFFIILGALLIYAILHSAAASLSAKSVTQRWFGDGSNRWYRLAFSLFGGITFLPILVLVALLPDQILYRIPFPVSLIFLALQAMGLAFIAWALRVTDVWTFLGLKQLAGAAGSVERLTTNGPYRWMRHPLYTASLLVLWFTPVMTLNLLALNVGVTAYFWIGGIFEERKLLRQFGDAYAEYRSRTPMFIPWPFSNRK